MITCAVAGGSTRRANTKSDPVIWLASAAAIPRSSRKATASDRTGTPVAAATSGSTLANSSGRAIKPRATSAGTATASSDRTCPFVIPKKLPKSRFVRPLRLPW